MRSWLLPATLIFAGLPAGCSLIYPTTVPIPTVEHRTGGPGAKALLVMLPGRGDAPEDYVDSGFIEMLAGSGLAVDTIAVDAHFGYYYSRTLLTRLHEDVIEPARAAGYEQVWILGVSMGGLGALLYAQKHAEEIDGLILLAPFLGDDDLIEEIGAAGGLAGWTPPTEIESGDYQRSLWAWLKAYTTGAAGLPEIHLGFGLADDFAPACELLAAVLPPNRVHRVPGGHEWEPWRRIFAAFLASGRLPKAGPHSGIGGD